MFRPPCLYLTDEYKTSSATLVIKQTEAEDKLLFNNAMPPLYTFLSPLITTLKVSLFNGGCKGFFYRLNVPRPTCFLEM